MIKINNSIGNFRATLYDGDNNCIGVVTTEIGLDDIRRQIKQQQLSGYYLKFNKEIIKIDKNARLEHWPKEFTVWQDILSDLI